MTQKQIKLDDYFLKRTEQYVHPNNFTGHSNGLYKITTNTNGHVTDAQAVSAGDLPLHNHNSSISYGQVDSTSTSTAFTATVPNITELVDGTAVMLRNGVVSSASGFTLNVNNLGAKPVYNSMANITRDTTIFNITYTMLFVYDSTRVSGGCWMCYRGYDSDTIGFRIRTNYTPRIATDTGYQNRIWLETDDGKYMPVNLAQTTDTTSDLSADMNTREFWIGGEIVYETATTHINQNARLGTATPFKQYPFALGYSFNNGGGNLNMTYPAPVYMVAIPTTNGKARLLEPYYTQVIGSANNENAIYIYLGHAYSATNIEMTIDHPIYKYSQENGIELYSYIESHTHQGNDITDLDIILNSYADINHHHYVNDIDNLPNIPGYTSELINDGDGINGRFIGEDELANVAFSGDYQDLDNSPSVPSDISELSDMYDTPFTPKSHSHGSLQNDGKVGTSNNASKNVVTDSSGKITTENKPTIPSASTSTPSADTTNGSYGSGTTYARANHTHPKSSIYAEASHTHSTSSITDSNTHSNIGNTTNTLENIISNIDTKLGSIGNIDLIEVTSSLGTASANTMNKLYLIAESSSATNDNYEIFVTVRTGTSGNYSYSWEKVDTARIDLSNYLTITNAQQTYVAKETGKGLFSGSYDDLIDKPTIPSASTTVPSADTTNGAYGSGTTYARANHQHPKSSLYAEASHTHLKEDLDFQTTSSSFNLYLYEVSSYMIDKNQFSIPSHQYLDLSFTHYYDDILINDGDYVSFKVNITAGAGGTIISTGESYSYVINNDTPTVKLVNRQGTIYLECYNNSGTLLTEKQSEGIRIGNPGSAVLDGYFSSKVYSRKATWLDMLYPIGSIYISTQNRNPSLYFGGTWEQIEDKFLLASSSTYAIGTTGGEASVTLTANQSGVPAHSHGMAHTHNHNHAAVGYQTMAASGTARRIPVGYNNTSADGVLNTDYDNTASSKSTTDNNTASNATEAHNNMPPYLAVSVWERIA